MLKPLDGFLFDLADTLLGQVVFIADVLQRQWSSTVQTVAVLNDLGLFLAQSLENLVDIISQRVIHCYIFRCPIISVLDKITELTGALIGIHRGLQRNQILGDIDEVGNMILVHHGRIGNFIYLRLFGFPDLQLLAGLVDLHQFVGPVEGQSDHTGLLTDSLQNGLTYPPDCVRNKVVAFLDIEALDGVHQTDIAFVDQVGQGQPLILVLLGHIYHKPQVCIHQLLFGSLIALGGQPRVMILLFAG